MADAACAIIPYGELIPYVQGEPSTLRKLFCQANFVQQLP
jgi:hypothetical protein